MGLHDREYYRESADGVGGWLGSRTICQTLILVTAAVFVAQLLTSPSRGPSPVQEWLQFRVDSVFFRGQIWRLLTYAFVHDVTVLQHIVFNMLGLFFFGPDIEAIYGRREFLRFYLVAAVCGALCHTGLVLWLGGALRVPMLGASAAVMGVMMLGARHFPRRQVYVMGVIPVEIRWLVAAYVIFDLFPVLSQLAGGGGRESQVAHAAHLGGLLYGFLFHRFDLPFRVWAKVDAWLARLGWPGGAPQRGGRKLSSTRRRTDVRLHQPEPETSYPITDLETSDPEPVTFQEQVDQVLAKIFEQGEASLTTSERRLLEEASERYKKRR
ncbi:MAG: rhomboid family intramembrane serine protease [Planctomycetaceae bacterium]